MAITVNSTVQTLAVPSAPQRTIVINADLDATSIANGYDVSAQFPGATVKYSAYVPNYDGATLRWFRLAMVSSVMRLQAYADSNGAPGTIVGAGVDLSGHTGVEVAAQVQ